MKRIGRLNTTGVWIIVNNKDKKIWLGTGTNCETLLKAKLSLCHNYGKGVIQSSLCNAPLEVQTDIKSRNGDIVDEIYLMTYNINSIIEEIKDNTEWTSRKIPYLSGEIKESLRYIAIDKIFTKYEPYSMRCTVDNCETVYNRNSKFILDIIKKGHIKMYKSTKIEYYLGKSDFGWEEVAMLNSEHQYQIQELCEKIFEETAEENVQEEIKVFKPAVKEDIISPSEIERLLTIEALLRDTTKEKLIEGIISDKTREIIKIFGN